MLGAGGGGRTSNRIVKPVDMSEIQDLVTQKATHFFAISSKVSLIIS